MSTTVDVTVWCDHPDCMTWTYGLGSNHTAEEARRGAKLEGWVRLLGKDLCPEHAPKGER